MQNKKMIGGVLAVGLLLSLGYASSQDGGMLQGKFGVTSVKPSVKTTTTTSTKPDFYFKGAVSYDDSLNYFKVNVCQTNVTSANAKLTSLKFSVARGQAATVQFTPTVTSSETCQTVSSGDLLSTLLISQSGSYDVTATLDTTSVQTEASESNNTLTTSGVVTESDYYLYDADALPDLWVSSVSLLPAPVSYEHSEVLANVCGLDDLMAYPSKGNVEVYYVVSQNGRTIESGETSLTGPKDPFTGPFNSTDGCRGYYIELDPSVNSLLSDGTVTTNIQLDVLETTPETDEDNNGFDQSFTNTIDVAW